MQKRRSVGGSAWRACRRTPTGHILLICSAVALSFTATGCSDPQCPYGYEKRGGACFRPKEAGLDEESEESSDGEADREQRDEPSIVDASMESRSLDAGSPGAAYEDAAGGDGRPGSLGASTAATMDASSCGDGSCPQCDQARLCMGAHELCVGGKCVVQPYCGDGQKGADEECDPRHPSWSAWSCSATCKITTAYTACGGDPATPQGGCGLGELCAEGACVTRCNVPGDCPALPADAGLTSNCFSGIFGGCLLADCARASDCPQGLVCVPATSSVPFTHCTQCSSQYACAADQTCKLASSNDKYRRCM